MNTPASKTRRRAILYTRVSTDDQVSGYSLRDQEARLRRFCEIQNIEVVQHFQEDGASAKTFNRPEFNQLLEYARKNRGRVDLLLVLKWDRFSRNQALAHEMLGRLKVLGLDVQAVEQPLDLAIPENKMMLALYLAAPEVENDRRAQNTKQGMRRAMLEGRFTSKPPRGYQRGRDENDRPLMRPSEHAPVIQEAFERIASGMYLPAEVLLYVRQRGVKCCKSQLYNLLRNPVYAGLIRVPAYRDEPERLVPALHRALVSEETFRKVQGVLDGGHKGAAKGPRPSRRVEYPLRGHLTCAQCGGNLTASAAKQGRYHYYHCQTPCKERFNVRTAHDAFDAVLRSVRVAPEVSRLYLAVLKDVQDEREGSREAVRARLISEIEAVEEKLTDAAEKLVEGKIPTEAYDRLAERYRQQKHELEDRLAGPGDGASDLLRNARYGLSLLADLPGYYQSAGIEAKDRIVGSIFPGNLVFENGAYRTPEVSEIIHLLRGKQPAIAANDRGPAARVSSQSSEVPETGIEPALP